jgi:hypothetical protein
VDVAGQRLRISVDGMPVLQHVLDRPVAKWPAGIFAFGKSKIEFENFIVERRPGRVFVVMQFSEPYQHLYEEVIRPVVQEFGLQSYHAGEVFGPGLILQDIANGILSRRS